MSRPVKNLSDLIEFCQPFCLVSYETEQRLQTYADLLAKWQDKINLISPSTLPDLWLRHMADSSQLMQFIKPGETVVDLGSGAGFPGMVLAIMGCEVTCVESDQRKCAFIGTVARETGIMVNLENRRIDDFSAGGNGRVTKTGVDWVTARALAGVEALLEYAEPYMSAGAKALFLKGDNLQEELTLARRSWHISEQVKQSLTDPSGSVLVINEAKRV